MLTFTRYRAIACAFFLLKFSITYAQNQTHSPQQDTLRQLIEEEERRLLDPILKRVPYERLDKTRHELVKIQSAHARAGIPNVTWQERGPSNAGGRTRALLFAPNDPAHKKVWAGSVAGGLWYTNDITDASAGWTPVSDTWENTVVTAITADPSNPQVMYVGTGDAFNSVTGGGIWKTTDGGISWTRLTSTIPTNNIPSIPYSFGYVQRLIVNGSGQVFAATRSGVVRSSDGGTTWQYVLAPNQAIGISGPTGSYYNDLVTDLELATDGILYAGFSPSRVFKSNDGSGATWTEITPPNAGGDRTELALAPSTNGSGQIIYGVSRSYNSTSYGKDIKWFKKSTNGGATWADLSIPIFNAGNHFTLGNGYNSLSLVVHPTDANTVYAGGYDWFRSTDGGTSWNSQITYTYQYQQGLWFQPGSGTSAAVYNDNGVYWSADWGNSALAVPTLNSRNNGYRVGEISSVSMKPSPGSSSLLAGVRPTGYVQLTSAGLSAGNLFWGISTPGITFIDADESTIQLIQSYGSIYQYASSGSTQLTSVNSYYPSAMTADYDSQLNTLYAADMVNNQAIIRKITGVGSTPQSTTLTLTGLTDLANYLKISPDHAKLYVGFYSGQVYQVSNLTQSTPTVTRIDNGALPQYGTVSCIDVGANDELLVTLSNYGTQSVWYTNNGGTTWTGKDQTNFGLPDVPVRSAIFNPQNRKQVLLGTDAGIWSTDDVTATNPGWAFTSAGMGPFRINQLRYRASDGRITAATNGRGIWTTDAFAVPYTVPSISFTNISSTALCAGNIFTVSFSTSGSSFGANNTFEVWLSDANGNFANQRRIGSGATSPISVTLPTGATAIPYGTNYQVKIIATNPEIESDPSGALAIGNLGSINLNDRRAEINYFYGGATICSGSKLTLKAYGYTTNFSLTSPDRYEWSLNGSVISGANAFSLSAEQAGAYTVTLKQGGCVVTSSTYTLKTSPTPDGSILSSDNGSPQCDDHPLTLSSSYIGETASYQWVRDGIDIAGATSYTYATTQTGTYSYKLTDGNCSFTATPSSYRFGRSLNAAIAPISQYQTSSGDTLLCNNLGGSLYISVSSLLGYTFQWYRNGTPIQGATFTNYSPSQPGIYSVLLKQGSCQTYSNAVAIGSSDFKAGIIASFAARNACPGETQSLVATPSINATYQWQKDGVDIPGATRVTLVPGATGNYTVRVTRGLCTATSEPFSLTFSNDIKPTVSISESCYGASLNSVGIFNNLSSYQFQWYRNGNAITGSTNSFLFASQAGAYSVRIINGSCTGLSKEVYTNGAGSQPSKPVITVPPKSLQLCQNNSALLSVTAYNGTLQWKRSGVAIAGANLSTFYATQSGFYSVVSTNGACQVESDPVEVKIGEATTATLSGNALISSGQSALLPVTFTGPAPWSFTLTNGQSVTATYQNPTFIVVSPTGNTTYQLASVANACGLGTTAGQAIVSVGTGSADVSLNLAVDRRAPNIGEVITYTLMAANAGPNDAVGIQLSSILPTGLTFVGSSSPGVSVSNGVVSANLGTVPANALNAVSFQATPTQPGVFATSAQITATQTPDPDSQPNSGTGDGQDDEATVDVRTPSEGTLVTSANPSQVPLPAVSGNQPVPSPNSADLSLIMQVDKLTPAASQNEIITTTITVNNRGGSSASSVVVQVVLPNGTFGAQSQAGWIPVGAQTYKRIINSLAAGQSATISLQWIPNADGTLYAQIFDMSESDPDSTPGNGYTQGEDDEAIVKIRVR